jgi:acetyl esterase/lipase
MNAEHDPRRDECEAYVARLQDAGVSATARTLEGHVHGSMGIPGWEPAIRWQQEANRILALAHSNALKLNAA